MSEPATYQRGGGRRAPSPFKTAGRRWTAEEEAYWWREGSTRVAEGYAGWNAEYSPRLTAVHESINCNKAGEIRDLAAVTVWHHPQEGRYAIARDGRRITARLCKACCQSERRATQ